MRRIDRLSRRHLPQRTAVGPAPVRPITHPLQLLHEEIDNCEVCAPIVGEGFFKPRQLVRGGVSRVVIVGQGPGKAEVRHSRAFAGMSGRRLDSWLVSCGASSTAPREHVYLTSVLKCVCPSPKHFAGMATRCIGFLDRQIALIRPDLIITLGEHAFRAVDLPGVTYRDALCTAVSTENWLLFTRFGFHFRFLPWPHPSGLNRWLNLPGNQARLEASFAEVRPYLGGVL
jgi:uracil-DNA glycosylase family 4